MNYLENFDNKFFSKFYDRLLYSVVVKYRGQDLLMYYIIVLYI